MESRRPFAWQPSTWETWRWGPATEGWFEPTERYGSFWATSALAGGETRAGIVAHPRQYSGWATVGEYRVDQPHGVDGFYGLVDGRSASLSSVRFVVQVVEEETHTTVFDQTLAEELGWQPVAVDHSAWSDGRSRCASSPTRTALGPSGPTSALSPT
ncbi:MAG: hypothetical protein ABGY41_15940 [Candidatus Poribacteria bacterium]